MKRSIVLGILLLVVLNFCNTLVVVKEKTLELYDVSIPLLPTKTFETVLEKAIKVIPQDSKIFVLSERALLVYTVSQDVVKVELSDSAVDFAVLDDGSIVVVSKTRIYLYDSNLSLRNTTTLRSSILLADSYKNFPIFLDTSGKVFSLDKNFSRIWEISGPEPFVGIRVLGDFLYLWSKSQFYTMKFNENVPVLESNSRLTMDVRHVERFRNNLVLLDSKGTLWLVSQNNLKVLDKIDINARSFASYGDYIYAVTSRGTIQVINVLFTTLKSLLTFGFDAKFVSIAQIDRTVQSSQASQEVSKIPESSKLSEKSQEDYLQFYKILNLPYEINSSCVIKDDKVYALTLTGEVMIANVEDEKVESKKVGFILTCDPVMLPSGQIVFGSWDKTVYIFSEKGRTTSVKVDSTISIAGVVTPYGFGIAADDGLFYFFDSSGQKLYQVILSGWLVCPPVAHESFGVITLDWLGILRLIGFDGKEMWSVVLKSAKQASVALSSRFAFVSIDEHLYCVELASGKIVWTSQNNVTFKQLVATETHLFALGESGDVFCFDFSGKQIWSAQLNPSVGFLITHSGLLIVATLDEIVCLNQTNGQVVYKKQLPSTASSYPVLSEKGYLIIPSKKSLIVYKINDVPQKGWSTYLKDAFNSGLFTKD
ncbi:pyrrolo-quinoline quinone [Pseudothermotoga thermarum DSM 5069]|uniref:Pyrrolo-quinoline quinone n=1 Tax=Pseudothermotoga thermarum DSM 5069 TaxID=688269 RepID=F7YW17_9THEM|nr:pyrrolo-quinoline quinone [Pseudothermotoga thermarum DSM 5069]